MKSYPKKWGKLFERYLDEYLPERKDEICARADREYRKLLTQMPDVGGKENMMASGTSGKRRMERQLGHCGEPGEP